MGAERAEFSCFSLENSHTSTDPSCCAQSQHPDLNDSFLLLRVMGKFEGVKSGNHDVIIVFGEGVILNTWPAQSCVIRAHNSTDRQGRAAKNSHFALPTKP